MIKLVKLAVSLALPFIVGVVGSLATFSNIPTWYAALNKPFFSPPNWVFGPVWTVLYVLMGVSFYLVWTARYKKPKSTAFAIFGVQLALNMLWSLVFFGLHAPWGGVAVIVPMLVAILATIKYFWPVSRLASYLLVPYALWVSFATILNAAVAYLN